MILKRALFLFSFGLLVQADENIEKIFQQKFAQNAELNSELNFSKFLSRYGLSTELQKKVDTCLTDDDCRKTLMQPLTSKYTIQFSFQDGSHKRSSFVINQDQLPSFIYVLNYYVKFPDIYRVLNAARMNNCIKMHGLDKLAVPRKSLGFIKGVGYRIFSKEVVGHPVQDISLQEIQQLAQFVKLTGFMDFGYPGQSDSLPNLIREVSTGKLVFIDTENVSFSTHPLGDDQKRLFTLESQLSSMMLLWDRSCNIMDKDAKNWLRDHIKSMMQNGEGVDFRPVIPHNKEYDDHDIDFEAVKKEFFKKQGSI